MDLLDFNDAQLYFERAMSPSIAGLLTVASCNYGTPRAIEALREAEKVAPSNLAVLVALYRYHYYQHELTRAREVGLRALAVVEQTLSFPDYFNLTPANFARAFRTDPGAARFYLHALKGVAYLNLRIGDQKAAQGQLEKLVELDVSDRLGGRVLLELLQSAREAKRKPTAD